MKVHVVAIWDAAIQAYLRPFNTPALGGATRGFNDEINRKESEMAKHPEDYELHDLGTFDEESGKYEQPEPPRCIARGKDVKIETP